MARSQAAGSRSALRSSESGWVTAGQAVGADGEPEVEVSLRRQDGHVQRQRERRKQASVAQPKTGPSILIGAAAPYGVDRS